MLGLGLGLAPHLRGSERGRFSHGPLALGRRLEALPLEPRAPQPEGVALLLVARVRVRVRVRIRVSVRG